MLCGSISAAWACVKASSPSSAPMTTQTREATPPKSFRRAAFPQIRTPRYWRDPSSTRDPARPTPSLLVLLHHVKARGQLGLLLHHAVDVVVQCFDLPGRHVLARDVVH